MSYFFVFLKFHISFLLKKKFIATLLEVTFVILGLHFFCKTDIGTLLSFDINGTLNFHN